MEEPGAGSTGGAEARTGGPCRPLAPGSGSGHSPKPEKLPKTQGRVQTWSALCSRRKTRSRVEGAVRAGTSR